MPPWIEPQPGSTGDFKFVRANEKVSIGNLRDQHANIAHNDGIAEELELTRKTNPAEADAGFIQVSADNTIVILGESLGLELPKVPEARERTIAVFESQSPNHRVIKH